MWSHGSATGPETFGLAFETDWVAVLKRSFILFCKELGFSARDLLRLFINHHFTKTINKKAELLCFM
jgi:hypothetical protein